MWHGKFVRVVLVFPSVFGIRIYSDFGIRISDFYTPLCLSSHRTSFVNSYSSVRVRPEAPFYGDHDVTAASRPVKAFVPVRIRLVTPISTAVEFGLSVKRETASGFKPRAIRQLMDTRTTAECST